MSEVNTEPTQGAVFRRDDADHFEVGLSAVVDYRGDVTLITEDGASLECFVFSRASGSEDALLCMVKNEEQPRAVAVSTIQEIQFSGKDTAEGKTFDRWIKRYIEKKLAGEKASIESESLED